MTLGGAAGLFDWTTEAQKQVDIEAAEMDEGLITSLLLRLWPKDQPKPSIEEVRGISKEFLEGNDAKSLAAVRRSRPDQMVTLTQADGDGQSTDARYRRYCGPQSEKL